MYYFILIKNYSKLKKLNMIKACNKLKNRFKRLDTLKGTLFIQFIGICLQWSHLEVLRAVQNNLPFFKTLNYSMMTTSEIQDLLEGTESD